MQGGIRRHWWVVLLTLAVGACSENNPMQPAQETGEIIAGVNLTRLFAPPSDAELQFARADLSARPVEVRNFQVVLRDTIAFGMGSAVLRIVSHEVDGATHYGAIFSPRGAAPGELPVLVYTHGGEAGTSVSELLLLAAFSGDLATAFVFVVPSYRSEPISYNGTTWVSDGPPSPFDRDVDDTLALLEAALQNTPEANPAKIGMLGFSRGACVAMLSGIRNPQISRIVTFFGPTDFLGMFVEDVFRRLLDGENIDLPGSGFAKEQLTALQNGARNLEEIRAELIRRSPVYFADQLPDLQLHHGTADVTVPVTEAERMIAVMDSLGERSALFESYIYPGGTHNPITLTGGFERVLAFLQVLRTQEGSAIALKAESADDVRDRGAIRRATQIGIAFPQLPAPSR